MSQGVGRHAVQDRDGGTAGQLSTQNTHQYLLSLPSYLGPVHGTSKQNNNLKDHYSQVTIANIQKALVVKSCPTHCDPIDCGLSGSSVHGIPQARILDPRRGNGMGVLRQLTEFRTVFRSGKKKKKILECVAISFSRESSTPKYQIWVSCITGKFLTIWATRETQKQ